MAKISTITLPAAAISDDALYAALCAVYDAYQAASWDEIDALQEQQAEIKGEMERRTLAKSRGHLAAAGLPASWARA